MMAATESRTPPSTSQVEAARRRADEAQQQLAAATQEIASLRPQAAAARELELRVRQLEATASARPSQTDSSKEDLARLVAANASAEEKLSTLSKSFAAVAKERDELRAEIGASRELGARMRKLESEQPSVATKEELARVVAAQASAENKLSMALRSYAMVVKERDDLRAQLAQLTTSAAPAETARPAGVPAKTASTTAGERRTEAR